MNETVASQKAAGTEMPMPRPDSGSLNIIAASGAEPVTMQNRTCGSPSAFRASSLEPVTPIRPPEPERWWPPCNLLSDSTRLGRVPASETDGAA